jgi:signal peptidase I
MKRGACIALVCILAAGCSPRAPDSSLILWEQPAPAIAAQAHAREKALLAFETIGKSMEPYLVTGDWVVVDPLFPYAQLREGDVIAYAPDWTPNLVLHRLSAKSGEAWIADGINNRAYENRANGNSHVYARHYWGKMVQGYTTRRKG